MADIKEMIQMRKRHFDVETDGFYGAYWKCKTGSDCAMIAMIWDDPEDYLARICLFAINIQITGM